MNHCSKFYSVQNTPKGNLRTLLPILHKSIHFSLLQNAIRNNNINSSLIVCLLQFYGLHYNRNRHTTPFDFTATKQTHYTIDCRLHLNLLGGRPLAPSPFTTKIPPEWGHWDHSSLPAPKLALVTNSHSKFGPPKQQEVVAKAGILISLSFLPVAGSQQPMLVPKYSQPPRDDLHCPYTCHQGIREHHPQRNLPLLFGFPPFPLAHCSQRRRPSLEWNQWSTWLCFPDSSPYHWR